MNKPYVDNAPGIVWRQTATGWEARWQARTDLIAAGFEPKSRQLWTGTALTPFDIASIQDQCNNLQAEMLIYGRGGLPEVAITYDSTVAGLIDAYLSDQDSNYNRVIRYCTRVSYGALCRRLKNDIGTVLVEAIDARMLLRWHARMTVNGQIPMAHSAIGMLRTLLTYGSTLLNDIPCRNAKALLRDMKFPMGKPRGETVNAEQAIIIRTEARKDGWLSIALAQAFQFECTFRQKDVIGEIVPMSERVTSDVLVGGKKWARGLQWREIDDNLVLRHVTSKKQKLIEVDLKLAPMVLEELELLYPGCVTRVLNEEGDLEVVAVNRKLLPESGPIIIHEKTESVWTADEFRRHWRILARRGGIPDHVKNMDTRAGAITEATTADAPMEHIKQAATHSNTHTTEGYSREAPKKVANVMKIRVASRNKSAT